MDNFIPLCVPVLTEQDKKYVLDCIDTSYVSSAGKYITKFEEAFASYVGSKYAVSCSSGTAAIHLALLATGVTREDTVFVPDFSFIATVNPVSYIGASPFFIDTDCYTWGYDGHLTAYVIDELKRHKKVVPKHAIGVHIFGMPMNIEPLFPYMYDGSLTLIEDATESLGSYYKSGMFKGCKVGSIGALGCFSFNGNKLITTGNGGMVVTNNYDLAQKVRHLSTQAKVPINDEYVHDEIGYNYRMTNMQAALGLSQLERIDTIIQRKTEIADLYDELLLQRLGFSRQSAKWQEVFNVNWLYSLWLDPELCRFSVRDLQYFLKSNGVETRTFWQPFHQNPIYKDYKHRSYQKASPTISDFLFANGISLPSSINITKEQQLRIVDLISLFAEKRVK